MVVRAARTSWVCQTCSNNSRYVCISCTTLSAQWQMCLRSALLTLQVIDPVCCLITASFSRGLAQAVQSICAFLEQLPRGWMASHHGVLHDVVFCCPHRIQCHIIAE